MLIPQFNIMLIPTLVLAGVLFAVGYQLVGKCRNIQRWALFSLAVIMSVPGVLFTVYYLHWFDHVLWFYQFRSLPLIELTAGGFGLAVGAVAGLFKKRKFISWQFAGILLGLWLIVPYLKPIITPIPSRLWQDHWDNGICIQSTPSSCGAASAASILNHYGVKVQERELAAECFTSRSGTENWYLMRMFNRRGFQVFCRIENGLPADLHLPAIAGVKVGEVGHFIAIIGKDHNGFITGDPLVGKQVIAADKMSKKFAFTGFFMEIRASR